MSEAAPSTSRERALEALRAYATGDADALESAVSGLDEGGWAEVYGILGGLLSTTVALAELTGTRHPLEQVVRCSDEVAAVAPPHYEFAISEAARAWARGDRGALRAMPERDLPGAVHMTAVFVTVLGVSLWGRTRFLGVLRTFHETAVSLTDEQG
ncbi:MULTISPECIES: hypothetical protein [unclassified Streptomyces]|uniref:hypothetical protein n=1 Tax=unclassified Streptomyces TaxID=2593676 RepID=UPI000DD650B3|nr:MULTISPECIES: hypothetical protein [unclassified Streptomyces]QZZ25395.1 hypothetical protein A7X85_02980 [Streptomyces sp. ST1015]